MRNERERRPCKTMPHDPRDTLVYVERPQKPLTAARADKLAVAHGFIDVVRMPTAGGMGELYRAYDPAAARAVVVKFVRLDTRSGPNLGRFLTEARSLARVQHENVARLFSFVEGVDPYFIMEDVVGGSLTDLLETGPLSGLDAAKLIATAARGVAAANRAGVIHRDLKPGNILISAKSVDASPKVADFGIAKDLDAVEAQTNTYALIGTPGYMSPEQADWRAAECDARTDVWGLAATLYCCVIGSPPFDRHLRPEAILKQPLIPAIVRRPDLSPELNAVICKGLEKEPADRYPTADEFADDLGRFVAGLPVLAHPRAWPVRLWRKARRVPKVAATSILVAILAMAALGAVMISDRKPDSVPEPTAEQKVERLMEELKEGKTVTLVGETGLPVWHKVVVGSATLEGSDDGKGPTTVHAVGKAVVLLTPPLPIERYSLSMEFKDIIGITMRSPKDVPTHRFGAIFAIVEARDPSGAKALSGFRTIFQDFAGTHPLEKVPLEFQHALYGTPPGKPMVSNIHTVGSHMFLPSRQIGIPGRWRKLRFEITPEFIDAFWMDDEGREKKYVRNPTRALNGYIRDDATEFCKSWNCQLEIPAWAPNRPVGIICEEATVGVRNVRIDPR